MNKAASNGRMLPEMTARATSKAARKANKAGAKGASIPYEPRRRGVTRSVIRIAFSSRVFLHGDEPIFPGWTLPGASAMLPTAELIHAQERLQRFSPQNVADSRPIAA